jgi:mannose-6-phosphate isomerase-like protein (cupin superfamily)
MKIIDIGTVACRHITVPGMTRTIKDILVTAKMTTHWATIPPGQSTAEHFHPLSEEIVYCVSGEGMAKAGEETGWFTANHQLFIPPGVLHRFTSTGSDPLIIFVVYSPPAEVPKQ